MSDSRAKASTLHRSRGRPAATSPGRLRSPARPGAVARQVLVAGLIAGSLFAAGCQSLPRTPFSYEQLRAASPDIRMDFAGPAGRNRYIAALAAAYRSRRDSTFDLLALSGGGADGAYGAGVLAGWSDRGDRPEFEVVTGVSSGALMAPFAFIGRDGDAELRRAFTDGRASNLLQPRWAMALYGPGLYRQRPLRQLITSAVTDEVIEAVAARHRLGARLFVATTSLDTQSQVIWDMGALAAGGGPDRRERFIAILLASASIPGIFPPVLIDLDQNGRHVRELHADGRTTANFFVAPERVLLDRTLLGSSSLPGHIWVVVNGSPEPRFAVTSLTGVSVAARGLDAMMKASTRINLIAAAEFAGSNDLALSVTMIPASIIGASLDFDRERAMQLFDAGREAAASGQAWAPYPARSMHTGEFTP